MALEEGRLTMWRHGDVLIAAADSIPHQAVRRPGAVLAEGELTGHSHRVEPAGSAELWQHGETLFLNVTSQVARVVHQEHAPIILSQGLYRVWRQREYTPKSIQVVRD